MAPTITSAVIYCNGHLTLTNTLRKPVVEKLRRDRINNSIEQLKSLLDPEILNQQPDFKLEKADILEMTVCLLRRQQQNQPVSSSSCSAPFNQGYSRCVQEIVHFLSKDEVKTQTQRLLSHFQSLQPSSDKNRRESDLPQKPVVEKLRRDRINNRIGQLKSLLGPEILTQQPDSKLEKADILEMTLCFLRRQQQNQPVSSCLAPVNQGYSRCVQEIVHFLSKDEVKTQSQRRLLSHFQSLHPSSDKNRRESDLPHLSSPAQHSFSKENHPVNSTLWRPWKSPTDWRKPVVEKLCRDRINNSIEQLKSLLGPEILTQQPDSKLEKADILEMTLCFLRRQQQNQPVSSCLAPVNQGYSRCVQEIVHFLSKD
ncbi:hypothetical protein J4Q44_G00101440 [Coregonus suidteri]|uniref:Transcription factor HES-5-like n=1 Tax=Coregonus suidteri TaxID=861788 RepID=A0AAN8R167_9TELE